MPPTTCATLCWCPTWSSITVPWTYWISPWSIIHGNLLRRQGMENFNVLKYLCMRLLCGVFWFQASVSTPVPLDPLIEIDSQI